MVFMPNYWLIGYSIAFCVLGIALGLQVVDRSVTSTIIDSAIVHCKHVIVKVVRVLMLSVPSLTYHMRATCSCMFDHSYLPAVHHSSSSSTGKSQQARSQHRSTNKSKRRRNDSRAMNDNDIASQPAANLVYFR
jgi:hypothetical protein